MKDECKTCEYYTKYLKIEVEPSVEVNIEGIRKELGFSVKDLIRELILLGVRHSDELPKNSKPKKEK